MVAAGSLPIILGLVEYFSTHRIVGFPLYAVGLLVGASSFAVRGWAGVALGRMWSVHIEIRERHQLVTSGPYRWVRHPIYTAAFLEVIGSTIILHAYWAALSIPLLLWPVIAWRIREEEAAMVSHFGEEYKRYIDQVPSVIPFLRFK